MPGSGFQNELVFAKNADFSGSSIPALANGLVSNMDIWMGHGSGNSVDVVSIVQGANMTITRAIVLGVDTLTFASTGGGGGGGLTELAPQTGTSPVVPTAGNIITFNGATVAAGVNPVLTNGTGPNTIQLQVQLSQAIASTDATKVGLCNFSSSQFSVDANGFVTLLGGSEAIDSIGVDATSGGGTNPVLPTAGGLITVNGATVAAGTNPIRTVSTAANVYQIQNQISQAISASDATKIGLSNFDSSSFTVDANGFVQLANAVPGSGVNELFDDFQFSNASGSSVDFRCFPFFWTNSSNPGSWSKTDEVNHPGVMTVTNASASATCALTSTGGGGSGVTLGNYSIIHEQMVKFTPLSSANPNYNVYIGMWDIGSAPGGGNGLWFQYNHAVNGGRWQINASTAGGGTTTADSGVAADTNYNKFRITVNSAGTSVGFYINGVQVTNSPITTNIPTDFSTNKMLLRFYMDSNSGATAKTTSIDYWYWKSVASR